jgi:hypothetical protein
MLSLKYLNCKKHIYLKPWKVIKVGKSAQRYEHPKTVHTRIEYRAMENCDD